MAWRGEVAGGVQCQFVTLCAQIADDTSDDVGQVGRMARRLAGQYLRQMHLDKRFAGSEQIQLRSIAQQQFKHGSEGFSLKEGRDFASRLNSCLARSTIARLRVKGLFQLLSRSHSRLIAGECRMPPHPGNLPADIRGALDHLGRRIKWPEGQ